jgi:hypothetical protein
MIYGFTIGEGVETTAPDLNTQEMTPTLWSLPFAGIWTNHGTLLQGITNELVTHFLLTTMD